MATAILTTNIVKKVYFRLVCCFIDWVIITNVTDCTEGQIYNK